jgi:hypothetical protein
MPRLLCLFVVALCFLVGCGDAADTPNPQVPVNSPPVIVPPTFANMPTADPAGLSSTERTRQSAAATIAAARTARAQRIPTAPPTLPPPTEYPTVPPRPTASPRPKAPLPTPRPPTQVAAKPPTARPKALTPAPVDCLTPAQRTYVAYEQDTCNFRTRKLLRVEEATGGQVQAIFSTSCCKSAGVALI